jgi:hypothetical protein
MDESAAGAGVMIATARLDLVATIAVHLAAELDEPSRLTELLSAAVPAGWPPGEYDRQAMAHFDRCLRDHGPAAVGWYGVLTRCGFARAGVAADPACLRFERVATVRR